MTDEPDNLVLRMLRANDIRTERILREVQALKLHSAAIENTLVALRKDIQNLDERLSRVETRLELRDDMREITG
jgi:predicted  nucleic acid-binding Zn-ribbon protein